MGATCSRSVRTSIVYCLDSGPLWEDHPHGSNRLREWIEETGYRRIIVKSDQEPAIKAVVQSVKNSWSGELIMEQAPKESHEKSNGLAEVTVQQVHGLARTFKAQIEDKCQIKVPQKHPVLAWLIEYAATMITLLGKGPDGFTPIHRLKKKPWRVALPCFGERVEFRLRTHHKLEARWMAGVYLGLRRTTSEKVVGTELKLYVVQSIRRKPADEAWDGKLLLSTKGTPWTPNPEGDDSTELPKPIVLQPELPDEPTGTPDTYDKDKKCGTFI